MRRKLAEQIAQAEEDQRSMQQSGAEKETLRAARQFQLVNPTVLLHFKRVIRR
jgi:hypothetical protein